LNRKEVRNETRIAIGVVALTVLGFAHDEDKGKPVNITGTVIDTGCYMSHDAIGASISIAPRCARRRACRWRSLIPPERCTCPWRPTTKSECQAHAFVAKRVTVSGTLLEKGGLAGLTIKTIEAGP
jgi:hypothetical protein